MFSRSTLVQHNTNNVRESSLNAAIFRSTDELRNRISQACRLVIEEGMSAPSTLPHFDCLLTLIVSSQTAYSAPITSIISEHLSERFSLSQDIKSNIHTCLHEAIANAVIHGNLQLSSPSVNVQDFDTFYARISERLTSPAYANRPVIIETQYSSDALILHVHDNGLGFDYTHTMDQTAFEKPNKGLFLMRSLGATLTFSNEGRTITLSFTVAKNTGHTNAVEEFKIKNSILSSRILVVDDTEFNRIFLVEVLRKNGFTDVHVACDGNEALEKTFLLSPDLVLLDLLMPVFDGFEYCKEIRKADGFKDMPVLVQTGISTPGHRNQVFAMGASDLIMKPVNADELIARCNIHLERGIFLNELQSYRSRLSEELSQARAMQNMLMPHELTLEKMRKTHGVHIHGICEASSEMGGDFWGALPISDTKIGLYICDFSGHGITAALNTFRLHTLIHDVVKLEGENPGLFLSELNNAIFPLITRDQFCTIFYGVIDTAQNELIYATAACPTALLWNHELQDIRALDGSGTPLGALNNTVYKTQKASFNEKDLLMLYSDVLIETPDLNHDYILEEELGEMVKSVLLNPEAHSTAREKAIAMHMVKSFYQRTGKALRDDLTITVCSR